MRRSPSWLRPGHRAFMASALFAVAMHADAHDFWLSAERTLPDGAPALRLWVGHHLVAEESRPYTAASTRSFRLLTADGTRDLGADARDGTDPFHTLPAATTVPALVVLDRNPVDIALESTKFDGYLAEEHLKDILAQRSGKPPKEGRERYTRHIKVLVGDDEDAEDPLHARVLGQALEIVLLDAPRDPGAGRKLRAKVLFEGKPLAGRTLTVLHDADMRFDSDNARVRTVVTGDDGIASFDYDQPGVWMLRMVHMQPCKTDCGDADWRSWWAAYAIQSDWLPAQTK